MIRQLRAVDKALEDGIDWVLSHSVDPIVSSVAQRLPGEETIDIVASRESGLDLSSESELLRHYWERRVVCYPCGSDQTGSNAFRSDFIRNLELEGDYSAEGVFNALEMTADGYCLLGMVTDDNLASSMFPDYMREETPLLFHYMMSNLRKIGELKHLWNFFVTDSSRRNNRRLFDLRESLVDRIQQGEREFDLTGELTILFDKILGCYDYYSDTNPGDDERTEGFFGEFSNTNYTLRESSYRAIVDAIDEGFFDIDSDSVILAAIMSGFGVDERSLMELMIQRNSWGADPIKTFSDSSSTFLRLILNSDLKLNVNVSEQELGGLSSYSDEVDRIYGLKPGLPAIIMRLNSSRNLKPQISLQQDRVMLMKMRQNGGGVLVNPLVAKNCRTSPLHYLASHLIADLPELLGIVANNTGRMVKYREVGADSTQNNYFYRTTGEEMGDPERQMIMGNNGRYISLPDISMRILETNDYGHSDIESRKNLPNTAIVGDPTVDEIVLSISRV